MTIAAYGLHVCPDDGTNLRPCSYTHDMYECPRCARFFIGESLTGVYETATKNGQHNRHFDG